MKYIKTYEFSFPFFKKKEIKKEVVEIPVNIIGRYKYNDKENILKIGDYTNAGIIKNIEVNDTDNCLVGWHIITDEGRFMPSNMSFKLYIYKGTKEDIEEYLDLKKYNL